MWWGEGLLGDTVEGMVKPSASGNPVAQRGGYKPYVGNPPPTPIRSPPSTPASPYSKHGLCLLPDAVQIHVGGCGKQK